MANLELFIVCPIIKEQKRLARNARMRKYNKEKPEKRRETERRRRAKDPLFKIRQNMRRRIKLAKDGAVSASTAMKYIGCSTEQLKMHLESKFTAEMTWENYGSYWHIDHIKPVSLFDLKLEKDLKAVNHYTNLQPLEKIANIQKGNKYGG